MNHKDVIKAIADWKHWKRMVEAPDRIDDLERRLEGTIAKPAPDNQPKCRRCGSDNIHIHTTGEHSEEWVCRDCDYVEGGHPRA